MKTDKEYQIGDKVKSKMGWNKGDVCTIIDIQPAIYMNGAKLISQYVMVQYSDDPEDTSGW